LRRLVAPGCLYGYDVVVAVGRRLFTHFTSLEEKDLC